MPPLMTKGYSLIVEGLICNYGGQVTYKGVTGTLHFYNRDYFEMIVDIQPSGANLHRYIVDEVTVRIVEHEDHRSETLSWEQIDQNLRGEGW